MFNAITITAVPVLDQDEALAFYVGKLGFEVTNDVDMGFMRWLTIALPSDPEKHLLLEVPGPPALSEEVGSQARALLTKGRWDWPASSPPTTAARRSKSSPASPGPVEITE